MPGRTPLAYLPIYETLHKKQIEFVVVGGQACNIWAVLYLTSEPQLKKYKPFTSKDLDVYSRSQNDVIVLAEAFGANFALNESDSPSPVLGYVVYKSSRGKTMPVSFINGAYGIEDASKIFRSRQTVGLGPSKIPVHVMHPFLTMQCKAALVVHQPRRSTRDLRHLKMSLHYTRSFIVTLTKEGRDREALKVCKSVVSLALSKLGREAYKKFQIHLEAALPSKGQVGSKAPKLENYIQHTLPERLVKIKSFRR